MSNVPLRGGVPCFMHPVGRQFQILTRSKDKEGLAALASARFGIELDTQFSFDTVVAEFKAKLAGEDWEDMPTGDVEQSLDTEEETSNE